MPASWMRPVSPAGFRQGNRQRIRAGGISGGLACHVSGFCPSFKGWKANFSVVKEEKIARERPARLCAGSAAAVSVWQAGSLMRPEGTLLSGLQPFSPQGTPPVRRFLRFGLLCGCIHAVERRLPCFHTGPDIGFAGGDEPVRHEILVVCFDSSSAFNAEWSVSLPKSSAKFFCRSQDGGWAIMRSPLKKRFLSRPVLQATPLPPSPRARPTSGHKAFSHGR